MLGLKGHYTVYKIKKNLYLYILLFDVKYDNTFIEMRHRD